MARGDAVVALEGVTVRFGGVLALSEADFTAREGMIASLIGPNGAGKTTMFNAVSGFVPVSGGRVLFKGRDITSAAPHKRSGAGIVRTFQNLEIFRNMSVLDNVMTGSHRLVRYGLVGSVLKTPRYWREERRIRMLAEEKLEFVGLTGIANEPAGELPFGSQRLLELARALAAEPEALLLDETAAGLNMRETRTLGKIILRIKEELKVPIALVEHDMDLVMNISDEVTVLSFGMVIAKGEPGEVQQNPEVIAAYLGEEDDDAPL